MFWLANSQTKKRLTNFLVIQGSWSDSKGYSRTQRKSQFYLADSYCNQNRVGTDENVFPSLRVGILDLEVDDRVANNVHNPIREKQKEEKNVSHIEQNRSGPKKENEFRVINIS